MQVVTSLDAVFAAMADPTRRAILARLAKGEAIVMELAGAGLVVSRVDGARRPRRLAAAGIDAMDQWLAMLRRGMEKSYERLDEVLASMEGPKKKRRGERT